MPRLEVRQQEMFSTLRTARLGQLAFALACVLAITGSVGLHPEPTGFSPEENRSGAAWNSPQAPDRPTHSCLACLAHRTVSLPRLFGVVLAPGATVASAARPRSPLPASLAATPHEGRAPPAQS
jgi:hypothetical protein